MAAGATCRGRWRGAHPTLFPLIGKSSAQLPGSCACAHRAGAAILGQTTGMRLALPWLLICNLVAADEITRVLEAKHAFDLLDLEPVVVQGAFRRVSSSVHPDKHCRVSTSHGCMLASETQKRAAEARDILLDQSGGSLDSLPFAAFGDSSSNWARCLRDAAHHVQNRPSRAVHTRAGRLAHPVVVALEPAVQSDEYALSSSCWFGSLWLAAVAAVAQQ